MILVATWQEADADAERRSHVFTTVLPIHIRSFGYCFEPVTLDAAVNTGNVLAGTPSCCSLAFVQNRSATLLLNTRVLASITPSCNTRHAYK